MIDHAKRSETLNEVQLVKNTKKFQVYLRGNLCAKGIIVSHKMQDHVHE